MEKTTQQGTLCSVFLTKYHSADQVNYTEMGRACSLYGGTEEVHIGFWWGNLRVEDHLKDAGVDGRIILKWVFERLNGGHRLDRYGSG